MARERSIELIALAREKGFYIQLMEMTRDRGGVIEYIKLLYDRAKIEANSQK
jgi:hypothetical protein